MLRPLAYLILLVSGIWGIIETTQKSGVSNPEKLAVSIIWLSCTIVAIGKGAIDRGMNKIKTITTIGAAVLGGATLGGSMLKVGEELPESTAGFTVGALTAGLLALCIQECSE